MVVIEFMLFHEFFASIGTMDSHREFFNTVSSFLCYFHCVLDSLHCFVKSLFELMFMVVIIIMVMVMVVNDIAAFFFCQIHHMHAMPNNAMHVSFITMHVMVMVVIMVVIMVVPVVIPVVIMVMVVIMVVP